MSRCTVRAQTAPLAREQQGKKRREAVRGRPAYLPHDSRRACTRGTLEGVECRQEDAGKQGSRHSIREAEIVLHAQRGDAASFAKTRGKVRQAPRF